MSAKASTVWVFMGANARFPAAVFSCPEKANDWIVRNGLTGCLTEYHMDLSAYDWAVNEGFFVPKRADHHEAKFKERFTSAAQSHFHYEDGRREG